MTTHPQQESPPAHRRASKSRGCLQLPARPSRVMSSSSTQLPPPWFRPLFFPAAGNNPDGIIAAFITYAVGFPRSAHRWHLCLRSLW
jgi:hypothetical protein